MIKRVYDGHYKVDKNLETGHERVVTTDAVAVWVYVKDVDQVVLPYQIRFPAQSRINPGMGLIEMVAGSFDYKVTIIDLIRNELAEEIHARKKVDGVYVPSVREDQITLLNEGQFLHSSPGRLTEGVIEAYVEITSDQIENYGDTNLICGQACETEIITRKFVPASEIQTMVFEDLKTWGAAQWFLRRRLELEIQKKKEMLRTLPPFMKKPAPYDPNAKIPELDLDKLINRKKYVSPKDK